MKEFIEKLIESLEEKEQILLDNAGDIGCTIGIVNAMECSKEIVNELAEEYKGGWIPCSERLPDIEADVLLSLRSLDVYTGFRANTKGCFYVDGIGYVANKNVLAWQPLPQPYREEGAENE